jgi:hypothetical protein
VCISAHAKDQATQIQSTKAQSAKCKYKSNVATHAESQNAKEVLLFARLSSLPLLAVFFFRPSSLFFFRFRCRFVSSVRPLVPAGFFAWLCALCLWLFLSRLSSLDGLFKPQPNRASTFRRVCVRESEFRPQSVSLSGFFP